MHIISFFFIVLTGTVYINYRSCLKRSELTKITKENEKMYSKIDKKCINHYEIISIKEIGKLGLIS